MPMYTYRCEACGYSYDKQKRFHDSHDTVCPQCGAVSVRRVIHRVGVVFKGSGFYVTDNRGGHSASSRVGSKSDKASETTPEKSELAVASEPKTSESAPSSAETTSS